jgi:hypothetical protein
MKSETPEEMKMTEQGKLTIPPKRQLTREDHITTGDNDAQADRYHTEPH